MKILCLAISTPGHLDFGGNGYLELVLSLKDRGHNISWISYGPQVPHLRTLFNEVIDEPGITHLAFNPALPHGSASANSTTYKERLVALVEILGLFTDLKPDIILFDRVLVFGAMVAHQLDLPYIAIGSPGGNWQNDNGIVRYSETPHDDYVVESDMAATELGWKDCRLTSFWLNSPYLNVCFMGKSFYPLHNGLSRNNAYINHFNGTPVPETNINMSISFGNESNNIAALVYVLTHASKSMPDASYTEVIMGNRTQLKQQLESVFQQDSVRFHGWTDFSTFMPNVRFLAFFGGIGTIWHCLNNYIPMLVIPGMAGDQVVNAAAVARLGTGVQLFLQPDSQDELLDCLKKFRSKSSFINYQENIALFRDKSNFTDDLGSACSKIEALGL